MKLVPNSGADRVIDLLRPHLQPGGQLGCVTPSLSLFAFAELRHALASLAQTQLILPPGNEADEALEFLGSEGDGAGSGGDRIHRNRLQARWLAGHLAAAVAGEGFAHGRGYCLEFVAEGLQHMRQCRWVKGVCEPPRVRIVVASIEPRTRGRR